MIFLPFQITDERRIEINSYRQAAIEIERKLQWKRQQTAESDVEESTVRGAPESNCDTSAAVDSLIDDTTTLNRGDVVDELGAAFMEFGLKETQAEDVPEFKQPQFTLFAETDWRFSAEDDPNLLSPCYSLQSSPSLGALNQNRNHSLYFTPTGRDYLSPVSCRGDSLTGRLIRSNSYTIDKPSPMLIKHLEAQDSLTRSPTRSPISFDLRNSKNNSRNSTPQPAKSKKMLLKPSSLAISKVSSSSRKSTSPGLRLTLTPSNTAKHRSPQSAKSTKSQNSASKRKSTTPSSQGGFKNCEAVLRSTYGSGKSIKAGKSPKTSSGLIDAKSKPINNATPKTNGNPNEKNVENILGIVEKQYAAKMKELLERQQSEQKRMHDEFMRQQTTLLASLGNLSSHKQPGNAVTTNGNDQRTAKDSNETMLIEEVNNEVNISLDSNGNRINRFSPESAKCIRRLCYENKAAPAEVVDGSSAFSSGQSEYTEEELKAVTTIAAYTRGYLTRRLFKTERVANLVQTSHDTLLLILQLYTERMEKGEKETPADINLKYNLIQQVICTQPISANSKLFIFLQLSISICSWHRRVNKCTTFLWEYRWPNAWISLPRTVSCNNSNRIGPNRSIAADPKMAIHTWQHQSQFASHGNEAKISADSISTKSNAVKL